MKRVCYLGLGHICVILGVVGLVFPGFPGVVFFLMASWAYSRSSERFQRLIHEHPTIGPTVIAWEQHQIIPHKAKIAIGLVMLLSLGLCIWRAQTWVTPTILGICLAIVFGYLVTRPSTLPTKVKLEI